MDDEAMIYTRAEQLHLMKRISEVTKENEKLSEEIRHLKKLLIIRGLFLLPRGERPYEYMDNYSSLHACTSEQLDELLKFCDQEVFKHIQDKDEKFKEYLKNRERNDP